MLIRRTVFLFGILGALSGFAYESLTHLDTQDTVTVFQDQTNPTQVLILSNTQRNHYLWDLAKGSRISEISTVDEPCRDSSLVYAHPVLVNSKITCRLSDDGKGIVYGGESQSSKPYFDFQFFHQDDLNIFFLANGRLFPDGESGYIDVKRVSRAGSQHDIQELLLEVPSFSGGMVHDQLHDVFFHTEATVRGPNKVHKILSKKLIDLIAVNQSKRFEDIAGKDPNEFEGLSLRLKINSDGDFLYDNADYGSFVIEKKRFKKHGIQLPKKCQLLGAWKSNWLFLCAGSVIVEYKTKDLLNDKESLSNSDF